ncbi:MAG: heme-dependent oxidative N-demethylase subunit alpha family protein, partial [Limisphaerales bacterium]
LKEFPGRHRPGRPEAAPLLAELRSLLVLPAGHAPPERLAAETGGLWPQDFLLLAPGDDGELIFRGGCVCFPTSWAPEEKLGRPVTAIHAPVPTLNGTLGRRIREYLARVPAGVVGERENWGLAATAELNLHPALGRPRLTAAATPATAWLRVERQAFLPLPRSGGAAFLIRIELERLDHLAAAVPETALALADALTSMPAEIAAYKGLTEARPALVAALKGR